jgi:preprotein translocase subunit SecG
VIYFVYLVHIVTCLFLIMVVLLQQGKGADLSVFGGGSTQAAFGARGAATLLHKLTVGCFVLFIVTTMSIGILQRSNRRASVMSGVAAPAVEETAPLDEPPAAPVAPAPEPAAEDAAAATDGAVEAPASAVDDAAEGASEEASGGVTEAPN